MSVISVSQYNNIHVESIGDPDPILLGYTNSVSVTGTNLIEQEIEITPILATDDFGALALGSAFNKELFYLYVEYDGIDKDPDLMNRKAIKLSVLSTDTINEIAVKLNELINMRFNRYFTSTIALNVVTIKCNERGIAEIPNDGSGTDYNFTTLARPALKRVSGYIYVKRDSGETIIRDKKYVSVIANLEDNGMLLGY